MNVGWIPQLPDVDDYPDLFRVTELYVDENRTGEIYSLMLPEGEVWYWTRYLGRFEVPARSKESAMQELLEDAGVYANV